MFSPTPGEVALVNAIFAQGDPQKLGILTGERATKIFDASALPAATLGDIWSIADPDNNGFLTRKGCAIAVRLIGWAQNGEEPSPGLLDTAGPLATIQGIQAASANHSGIISKPPSSILTGTLPPLTPTDRNKFLQLFNATGPVSGFLSGDKARELFVRSKLPLERLNLIWNLVDRQNRGSLDATEFVLAMYLIQGSMGANPTIQTLPQALPTFLVDIAAGRPVSVIAHHTGGSLPSPGLPPMTPQFTGTASNRPPAPLRPNATGLSSMQRVPPAIPVRSTPITQSPFPLARPAPVAPQPPAQQAVPWDITAEEKATSDGYFSNLDTSGIGYLEGAAAVPFMLLSNLPEATLAAVWDLADLRNDGKLSREAFAVAMRLINDVLAGKPLPNSLPVSLVPPSLRAELGLAPVSVQAPTISSAQQDLWLLENSPAASLAALPATTSVFSSPSIPQEHTPALAQSPPINDIQYIQQQQPVKDLLGDDDEVEERNTRQLAQNSVEIANAQNHINSTQQALTAAKSEREKLEAEVESSAATLSELQAQLGIAKTGFDTETKLLTALRERYAAQLADIAKTRNELIRAESDLSALKLEKTEIQGNLLRDKDDVRDLQQKLKDVAQQTDDLRKDIEKVKKESRLQKGLLAIAKKQLATAETDRDVTAQEYTTAEQELSNVQTEVYHAEHATSVSRSESKTWPTRSDSTSLVSSATPAADSIKSNNPFDKLVTANNTGEASPSFLLSKTHGEAINNASPIDDDDPFGFNKLDSQAEHTPVQTTHTPPKSPQEETSIFDKGINPIPDPVVSTNSQTLSATVLEPSDDNETPNLDPDLPPLQEIKEIAEDDSSDEEDFQDARNAVSPSVNISTAEAPSTAKDVPGTVSFDDAFGDSSPHSPPTTSSDFSAVSANAPIAQNGSSLDTPHKDTSVKAEPQLVTGADAFDQTFTTQKPAPFVFNAQFEDSFDFSSFDKSIEPGSGNKNPTASAGATLDSPTSFPAPATVTSQRLSFEDAFGVPKATTASPSTNNNAAASPLSFEDAFSVLVPTPTANTPAVMESEPKVAANNATIAVVSPGPVENADPARSVRSASTSSPRPERSSIRAASPVNRSSSPKVEVSPSTPKARTSNASASVSSLKGASASAPESVQTPPSRHSKLSIHFPFGRSKTKKEKEKKEKAGSSVPPVPTMPPTLTGDRYNGSEDDVDAVKQLCTMGFTRDEAIAALEKHGYNFDRALNSLLK